MVNTLPYIEYSEAESDLVEAIKIAGATGSWVLALTYASLGLAYLGQNRIGEALDAAVQALVLGQADDSPEYTGIAWRVLGSIAAQTSESVSVKDSKAEQTESYTTEACFEQSVSALAEAGMDGERARTLREWANYEFSNGNTDKGKTLWAESRGIFEKLGAQLEVERMEDSNLL